MIYDCFTFFNELELLELRLEILAPIVDKFVLVEATKTHSNNEKPLYFNENKERFAKWNEKIIHIIVDTYPEYKTSWTYENYQRNCIMEGLKNCSDEDIIILSDLDEIPRPEVIPQVVKKLNSDADVVISLQMSLYYYYLNYQNCTFPTWFGSKIFKYQKFSKNLKNHYDEHLIKELNETTTPTKIRFYKSKKAVKNAGWHFSYLCDIDGICYKLCSFSHQEFNKENILDKNYIYGCISKGRDIFGRNHRFISIPIDATFPRPIVENPEKYHKLICNFPQPKKIPLVWDIFRIRVRDKIFLVLGVILPKSVKIFIKDIFLRER